MQRLIYLVLALVALFLVIYYYKGTSEVVKAGGGAFSSLISSLQGRNAKGDLPSSYPK